ncbi:MAG: hypothetical protein IJ595_06560 [Oscillospiraceae bacterium]|nr:hypothetical protein [Oscillospiraceae bacterium]
MIDPGMDREAWIGLLLIAAIVGIILIDRHTGGWLYWLSDRKFRRRWEGQQIRRAGGAIRRRMEKQWALDARNRKRMQEDADAADQTGDHRGGKI